jgi:DNA repair protein RadC
LLPRKIQAKSSTGQCNRRRQNTDKPHYLGHRKRLRARFIERGIGSLYDYEIIELLLTFSIPYRDVKPVAKQLLDNFQSIRSIFDATPEELKKIPYIKDKTVELIHFIKEISAVYQKQKASEESVATSRKELIEYCIQRIGWEKDEEFHVIYLDGKFAIMKDKEFMRDFVSKGTINKASVYPRKVMESALKNKAHALIFAHNHTNGNLQPSEQDINLTKALSLAATTLGIIIYDHIIVSGNEYYSFREKGLL